MTFTLLVNMINMRVIFLISVDRFIYISYPLKYYSYVTIKGDETLTSPSLFSHLLSNHLPYLIHVTVSTVLQHVLRDKIIHCLPWQHDLKSRECTFYWVQINQNKLDMNAFVFQKLMLLFGGPVFIYIQV